MTNRRRYELSRSLLVGSLMAAGLAGCASSGGTWSQWGGHNRDFNLVSAHVADHWPEQGPARVWQRPIGDGYSAIAVENGNLFTMFRDEPNEVVVALDAGSGTTKWEHRYPAAAYEGMETRFGLGPRATPLLVDGRVYTLGMAGMLSCLDRDSGRVIWSHDLLAEYKPTLPKFGCSASPLRYKNTVIVVVGGPGSAVMAFNLGDGSLVWRSQDFGNTYSSPIVINVDGQDQLAILAEAEALGLDPHSGAKLWNWKHENQWKTNINTPIWGRDGLLFVSSGGEAGSRALKLTQADGHTNVAEVWAGTTMKMGQGVAVRVGDFVYGVSGDENASFFAAVNVTTGEAAWRERWPVKSTLMRAGNEFIVLGEDGQLFLVSADPKGVKVISKCQAIEGTTWTTPTLVGTKLFVRDRDSIMAFEVG